MKRKKYKWNEVLPILVNKELEKYKLTIEDIKDDSEWFRTYTFTSQEFDEWYEWAKEFLYNNITPKPTRKQVKKELGWFVFNHGLAIDDGKDNKGSISTEITGE